jgi:hypothetical protein
MDSCVAGGTLQLLEIFAMVSSLLYGVLATVTTVVRAMCSRRRATGIALIS